MDSKAKRLLPVVGTMTAAATAAAAGGVVAPLAQAAPAAPDGATAVDQGAGLAQDGTYESCEAYFGYGKEDGAGGLVAFDVSDDPAGDGVDHAVETDTQVIFVIGIDDGDPSNGDEELRCTPDEVTEAEYETAWSDIPFAVPPYPGPGHYSYPVVDAEIPDEGTVTSVAFEVVGVPASHTLIDPVGPQPLDAPFPNEDPINEVDPRLLELIESEVSAAAAAAFDAAVEACSSGAGESFVGDDPDYIAAVDAIAEIVGFDGLAEPPYGCDVLFEPFVLGQFYAMVLRTTEYVEPITLRPAQQATTSTSAPPSTAPRAVVAQPTYTG